MSDEARAEWDAHYEHRGSALAAGVTPELPPPSGLRATPGAGHVLLTWDPVEDAVGYQVYRDGVPVDHQGGDVLAVPDLWYVDTTGEVGREGRYAVSAIAEVTVPGTPGAEVVAAPGAAAAEPPVVTVQIQTDAEGTPLARPWRPMIGSERLSQLLSPDLSGGRPIGAELFDALRRVRDELGVEAVRAHAILHDDLGVYCEEEGEPRFDFSTVDQVYDRLLGIGLRPVVEIGFMPRAMATETGRTVFGYQGYISPPADWDKWAGLVRALVAHLLERYGQQVLDWDFEVWNEANLEVFWTGTQDEWMRLYDVTAEAVKAVDERIQVGGPSSAAAGWVDDLLLHARKSGAPVDFVSTHTYGNAPLDLRPTLRRLGFEGRRILWTEWGVTPTHFNPVNDGMFAATFLLSGMRSAAGRLEALSYWVASDHFEELGRPQRFLHGGFGLITVGGIAKPRYHALRLLSRLGDVELPVTVEGDGAGGLVQTWAGRRADGSVAVLAWVSTLDQTKHAGDPALARRIRFTPTPGATLTRLDSAHSDVTTLAAELGVDVWPDEKQWKALAAADALSAEPLPENGDILVPQPGAVLVEFPAR